MPPKKIKLHVYANNDKNGVLNVKVSPWRVRLFDPNDVVSRSSMQRALQATTYFGFASSRSIRSTHGRSTRRHRRTHLYAATGAGRVTSPTRNNNNGVGDVISYGLTIAFQDERGKAPDRVHRPRMIIDYLENEATPIA